MAKRNRCDTGGSPEKGRRRNRRAATSAGSCIARRLALWHPVRPNSKSYRGGWFASAARRPAPNKRPRSPRDRRTEAEEKILRPQMRREQAAPPPINRDITISEGVTVKEGRFAGVWPSNETFFTAVRSKGGLIAVSVDPLTAHECGNQRYFAIPWLDACLSARLPKVAGQPLTAMATDNVWLAPLTVGEAVPAGKYALIRIRHSAGLSDEEIEPVLETRTRCAVSSQAGQSRCSNQTESVCSQQPIPSLACSALPRNRAT